MTLETQHGEIGEGVVARVFIDVMNLQRLAALPAHAASRVRKHHVGDEIRRNRYPSLAHTRLASDLTNYGDWSAYTDQSFLKLAVIL